MNCIDRLVSVPVAELGAAYSHARVHPPEQLAALKRSLAEFGLVLPLLIDGEKRVIAGRAVLQAAVELGLACVPCVCADWLTAAQCQGFAIAHNRLAELSCWDETALTAELLVLRDVGFDLTLTGFEGDALLLEEPCEVVEDTGFDSTLPGEPLSKPGALYRLGRHRLLCGDATVGADVARLMGGERADLLLTDPPYNVAIVGGTASALTLANDSFRDAESFCAFLRRALTLAMGVMEPGAGFYIWHPDGAPGWAFREACRLEGLPVRQCLVWVKQSATLGRQDYHWQHEPCLHGQLPEDLPQMAGGEEALWEHESCLYGWKDGRAHLWCSDRKQTTVLHFDRPLRSAEHPTMKPLPLMAYLICNSTRLGARVADFFAGSGSTLLAAEQTGRSAYCMELEPRYVDVIIRRWETFTGGKAERVDA